MAAITEAVSAERLMAHTRAIAQWVRLSGTPDEGRAFDYIADQLATFGYAVTRHAHPALVGYPGKATLEVLAPERLTIRCNGYSLSPATSDAGVAGELVFVGGGQAADYPDGDLSGAIAISEGLAMPPKTVAADARGVLAQIHINDEHIHEMCISPVWGTPTPETAPLLPKTPAVAVTRADGDRLLALLQRGPVRLRVVTRPFQGWVELPIVTADLPGGSEDTFVLFSGHVDSWHYGAMDNGTANATQLEVARLLAERRDQLLRGVRFAFWSGHSHGRYASSCWYADTFWHDLHERCVCHVNVDSVGGIGATVLEEAPTMAETFAFGGAVLRETAGVELDYKRISRSSDQSFWGHGIPSLYASLSEQPRDDASATGMALATLLGGGGKGGGLGWWWHTTEDTLDKIDPNYLRRDARVYAAALWRLCTEARLPFDYAVVADEFVAALDRHGAAAGSGLDLAGTRALATELGARLRARPAAAADAAANHLTMALGRLLIPVNYTRSGPFEHDLALGAVPLQGLADSARLGTLDRTGAEFRFLQARLVRERNRIEHALRAALRLLA